MVEAEERGDARFPAEDGLEELLFQCLEELELRGEAALERWLGAHPAQASALRSRLAALRGSGLISGGGDARMPERLGDFQLLERLGEGGMGVVYRARQLSLGREVALKVVRPDLLHFAGARERFRREVETVAGLRHPGIVAVHTVGEEDGVPFFAMELVRGESVEERLVALAGRPLESLTGRDLDPTGKGTSYLFAGSWEEACLRVVRQACEALQFAHEHGVLHRDLKPSNLMLSGEGVGRALLVDFGLARGGGADKLTRSGSQLGSLRYMAPEQLRGDASTIGPRSDVYGLGVTLYEMLSRAPAFEGSEAQIVLAVSRGELAPLRRRNPAASWEAETICAAAIDPDPARRYASAADLARDLANALERRPLEARRAGAALRLRRWIERHPAATLAALLGVLLVVGGPATYAWQQHRASRDVAVQRDRAERALASALEAIERMLSRVGSRELAFLPAMETLRERLLEDAVALLEGLVATETDSGERGQLELASALRRLSQLYDLLGRSAQAAAAAGRGHAVLEGLVTRAPGDVGLLERWARAGVDQGRLLARAGELVRARELHERLEGRLGARAELGGDPRLVAAAASNRAALGATLSKLGEVAAAEELLRRAADDLDLLVGAGGDADALGDAFWAWVNLGQHHLAQDAERVAPQALAALERAVELMRRLLVKDPLPVHRHQLASSLINLGGAARRAQDFARAEAAYAEARALLVELVHEHPSTLTFQLELATVLNQLGLAHDLRGDPRSAGPYYRETARLLEDLWRNAPQEPLYGHRFAIAQLNLSSVERAAGDLDTAEARVARGIEALRMVLERSPDDAGCRQSLLELLGARWQLRLERGDHAGAARAAEDMAAALPNEGLARHRAAFAHVRAFEAAAEDLGLEPAERDAARARYAARACELTREAYELGAPYTDVRAIRNLTALHGRPEFEALAAWFEARRTAGPRGD